MIGLHVNDSLTHSLLLPTLQAYSGVPPSNDDVKEHREMRSKILRAKGVYLPDPSSKNAASPSLMRLEHTHTHTLITYSPYTICMNSVSM